MKKLLFLLSGLILFFIFVIYSSNIQFGYVNYAMLISAFISLLFGFVQIKIKSKLYLIIFKYLFSIAIMLWYILMFIGLAVPNYELKHILFQLILVISLLVLCTLGLIEVRMHNAEKIKAY
jgi:hypothetical protein